MTQRDNPRSEKGTPIVVVIIAVVIGMTILCALILPNIRMFQSWMFGAF